MGEAVAEECVELERLLELAKLRIGKEEACRYIQDVRLMMEDLRHVVERYPGAEPLYYVWDVEEYRPPEPSEERTLLLSKLGWIKLDEEGRVVLPWRPRG
ncbi:MAG: hypothetical protein F7C36_03835 [Desulfurococcales archaeon]|nr:hypothetical protein [Desulfurococcales archaeon]